MNHADSLILFTKFKKLWREKLHNDIDNDCSRRTEGQRIDETILEILREIQE